MEEIIKILKKEKQNEWVSGVIPGLLLHMCLSIVYCWSLFKVDISSHIQGDTSWAFSIMVAVLAMTAIISAPYVERKTRDAARYGAVLFSVGLVGSGLSCQMNSLMGLYFFFGGCLGMGAGLIYEVPLKTLSKWFRGGNKGFIGKIFVILSSASSFIMVPAIKNLVEDYGVVPMFTTMGLVCLGLLMLAGYLLADPEDYSPVRKRKHHYLNRWKASMKYIHELPGFLTLWTLFFINLSCGLAIISCERDLLLVCGFAVVLGMALSRMASPAGKGVSSVISRRLGSGNLYKMWRYIYGFNILGILLSFISRDLIWLSVLMINFGYGASFAIQPGLIGDLYGRKRVSKVYPLLLTAWAGAGLFGNRIGAMVYANDGGLASLLFILGIMYIIGFIISLLFKSIYDFESK